MPGVDFEEAPTVRAVAAMLIDDHHPHLTDAKDLIGFYFRYGTSDWAGKAKKCTAFERHMTGKQLFVFVNAEAWEALKHDQRLALVDHELCHFSRKSERHYDDEQQGWVDAWTAADDSDSWGIRDHDVEEFSDVIKRHGLWEQGIEQFAQAVRNASYQADLFEDYSARSTG
ncbi:putative metallopeptidase [Alicyclobacillus sp. ALC3]|uniref:putative metallopeptidase n=1 Tax=Alicyclobacillus sp. ALC3 TaxID=2796143 RepID=UPI0023792C2A|nr:putative metallopeptidase [Alicyclobacillus sp. ALC3]WDL97828.1 hypothetical protein JC200_03600 [Alicyclobacillus sp. ALC3]